MEILPRKLSIDHEALYPCGRMKIFFPLLAITLFLQVFSAHARQPAPPENLSAKPLAKIRNDIHSMGHLQAQEITVQGIITSSDENLKETFEEVNSAEILEKVANLPVTTWNFIADEDTERHLGPTAQVFHAAFGLGQSETHINMVDASGVALTAIQGLDRKVDATREELLESNARLLGVVETLQDRLEALEANL